MLDEVIARQLGRKRYDVSYHRRKLGIVSWRWRREQWSAFRQQSLARIK
jgi:hypothetical protein